MAVTQIGKATVWGIDGTVAYSGLATTDQLPESVSYTDGIDEHESKDGNGEVVGLKLFNPREDITINFWPAKPAGTGAIAAAKANVVLPTKGSKVTIADMPGSLLNDTTWLYLGGGSIELSNTGEVRMVLPLRQYGTDIAATATT